MLRLFFYKIECCVRTSSKGGEKGKESETDVKGSWWERLGVDGDNF